MLTPIAQSHLAALESELARVTKQRDALRNALQAAEEWDARENAGTIDDEWDYQIMVAYKRRNALQACQD